ncbi:sulfurtransferase TusA family protein [Moritella marina ATCC 15381]|uniref:Sulfurtransferase TusA family protein n=1 Tax=Moritella marina ATCC 15381 TaxID=1202962 RepID=A0A5J6WH19_MORMI|nr:sulfurtransferase TusA family protein [Moritella marina]QFI36470.1 sulfurtransferase TusA family protein [Moritella marina ATCC 15381]
MQQLDLSDYACPLPLIKVKLWLKQAELGTEIIVLLTDPGSRQDIPKFLISLGNTVVELENSASILRIQITKLTQHLTLNT